jgi:hypothetical protein
MILDQELLKAKVFHGLKSLQSKRDTLEPRFLEVAICDAFGYTHVRDSTFYADGINQQSQMSVKTRMINPHLLKTKAGRDFQTHPSLFLGPHQNVKQNMWTAGLEVVQRRQKLDFKNDSTESPKKVGMATLLGFETNVQESYKKFNTDLSYEVILVHGYSRDQTHYIVSLFWQEYKAIDASVITWIREGSGVAGYMTIDGVLKKYAKS